MMSDYYRKLSLMLSRVMDDIGVNEDCVMRMRRSGLMAEKLMTLNFCIRQINGENYIFGSQTEGTTTPDLQSDIDVLSVFTVLNVIQNWKDWTPGTENLLMIQDESFPGYCILQLIRPDLPLPATEILHDDDAFDGKERVILKNTMFTMKTKEMGRVQHGPAATSSKPGGSDHDFVPALVCQTWPQNYKRWSMQCRDLHWPTSEMINYMESSGSFVVPVGHRLDEWPERGWRISTSLAERCLMFSLNITQIRCYVLLKMIVKTFIEPYIPDVISSYICKTLLFHCIERTDRGFWIESNLVTCVIHVLRFLLVALHTMDCPNYFNESANLLAGKLNKDTQRQLMTRVKDILTSRGTFLLRIEFDQINIRLTEYIRHRELLLSNHTGEICKRQLCADKAMITTRAVAQVYIQAVCDFESRELPKNILIRTLTESAKNGRLQSRAAALLYPFFCSYLASSVRREGVLHGQTAPQTQLQMYKESMESDAASSRLKFASFLYCSGLYKAAITVLQDVERRLTSRVVPWCCCHPHQIRCTEEFIDEQISNTYPSLSYVAFCVMFTKSEIHSCPRDMQFELFRSTENEKLLRGFEFDSNNEWMGLSVMDCVPFLYYLQYMVARNLGHKTLQSKSLENLETSVNRNGKYLGHRETAYNILGRCMEYENNYDKAFMYYKMSVQERPSNNAVRWHIPCFTNALVDKNYSK